jgi:hypothetical protein
MSYLECFYLEFFNPECFYLETKLDLPRMFYLKSIYLETNLDLPRMFTWTLFT